MNERDEGEEEEGQERGGGVTRPLHILGIKGDAYLQGGVARGTMGERWLDTVAGELWSPKLFLNSVFITTWFHLPPYYRG